MYVLVHIYSAGIQVSSHRRPAEWAGVALVFRYLSSLS